MKKLKLALIGKDVSRSESERMHRFILQGKGAACDYENVSVGAESFGKEAGRLLKETDGFNVTIPYKKSIIALLNETKGDAAAFDSVNTVLSAQKTGYNTDGVGFLLMLRRAGVRTQDRRALVLGAGGAGRSTEASLKKAGAEVFLYQRRQELLKDVCFSLGVRAAADPASVPCDVLINCTGVGMHESVGVSPVGEETIKNCAAAVDLIYRPAQSEFLRLAQKLGKKTLNGHAMLFYQAYLSDCLYLALPADEEEAEGLYRNYLEG